MEYETQFTSYYFIKIIITISLYATKLKIYNVFFIKKIKKQLYDQYIEFHDSFEKDIK